MLHDELLNYPVVIALQLNCHGRRGGRILRSSDAATSYFPDPIRRYITPEV